MCLILFALDPNDRYRLIVAANRDEFYERPTESAAFWPHAPHVLAGRDGTMGGTWLGVDRHGRFAAVTNFREDPPEPLPPRSRGDLPADFLVGREDSMAYLNAVSLAGEQYRGFNLIVADPAGAGYYSNRNGARSPGLLSSGCYGLSNQLLDCDWPKVVDGRSRLQQLTALNPDDLAEALFAILLDDDGDEREFSNSFISSEIYGTRAATVVLMTHSGEVYFEERNFGVGALPLPGSVHRFSCNAGS